MKYLDAYYFPDTMVVCIHKQLILGGLDHTLQSAKDSKTVSCVPGKPYNFCAIPLSQIKMFNTSS